MLMGVSVKMVGELLCKQCQSYLFDNFKVEMQIQQKKSLITPESRGGKRYL